MFDGLQQGLRKGFEDFLIFFGNGEFDDLLNLNQNDVVPFESFDEGEEDRENVLVFQKPPKILGETVDDAFDGLEQVQIGGRECFDRGLALRFHPFGLDIAQFLVYFSVNNHHDHRSNIPVICQQLHYDRQELLLIVFVILV